MIVIEKPHIISDNTTSKLVSVIRINDNIKECFFEVDKKYEKYLTTEVADAFVIGILHRAMTQGLDILSKAPLSESVLYGIENFLIPNLCFGDKNMHKIKIKSKIIQSPKSFGAVGTGMSCGIDSFQTFFENTKTKFINHNITHLCLFNAGAFYSDEENFATNINKAQIVADRFNLPLIVGNSNIHHIFPGDYQITHTFYSLFCVFALRKLFHIYYYASAYPFYKFDCTKSSIIGNGTAAYDLLLFHCLSDENILLYSGGAGVKTRVEKTKLIINQPIVWSNLDVCVTHNKTNCGKCLKCKRTMLQLYFLGKLDKFKQVFPIEYFYKNKNKYIRWMKKHKKSKLGRETYEEYIANIGDRNNILSKLLSLFNNKRD